MRNGNVKFILFEILIQAFLKSLSILNTFLIKSSKGKNVNTQIKLELFVLNFLSPDLYQDLEHNKN